MTNSVLFEDYYDITSQTQKDTHSLSIPFGCRIFNKKNRFVVTEERDGNL